MAKRAAHMNTDAGVWGPSVSGKVDVGETFNQAVLREANEELGLSEATITPVFLHKETYANHSDGRVRHFGLFYAKVPSELVTRLQLDANEVSEVKWFKESSLKRLADTQSDSLIISTAKELWQSIFLNLQPVIGT